MTPKWVHEFVKCLNSSFRDNLQFEKALSIKHQHLPRLIYKYRKCNAYSVENLATDTVWLGSASSYNDPYDSAITISFQRLLSSNIKSNFAKMPYLDGLRKFLSDDEFNAAMASDDPMENFLRMILEKDKTKPPAKLPDMLRVFRESIEHVNKPFLESMRKVIQDEMVLCSFSTVPDSIIMWGHYAQNHEGFCIEYDLDTVDANDARRRMLYPVIYSNKLFDATMYFEAAFSDITKFNNTFATLAALYKSPEWLYEKEWRLLFPGGIYKPSNYPMPQPRSVFLGSRMSNADRKRVRAICGAKNIECHQMRLSAQSFKLEPEKL